MESRSDPNLNWEYNGCTVPAIVQCNGTVNQQPLEPHCLVALVFRQQISEVSLNIRSSVNMMGERGKKTRQFKANVFQLVANFKRQTDFRNREK